MKKITTWRPDTCGCELQYEWDDSVPQEQREHTFVQIKSSCPAHAGLAKDAAHFDHVQKENQTKNKAVAAIMQHVGRVKKTSVNERGETVEELDPAAKVEFRFTGKDAGRALVIEVKGTNLSKAEKDAVLASTTSLDKGVTVA